jgi:hypothetical protein
MEKVARWTIGSTTNAGFECLQRSIESFTQFYDVKVVICHNCPREMLPTLSANFVDQKKYLNSEIKPKGVAWKLYPPRIAPDTHEIQIDNDIVFEEQIEEIDQFFAGDCTLLLQASSRNYGRFDNHVPPGHCINSGIFGMPPGFNFEKYINFHVHTEWEENATGKHAASKTFDEQGLVAFALLNYHRYIIIPETTVTNCENNLIHGKGLHFIGLNRDEFHEPYRVFKSKLQKIYL